MALHRSRGHLIFWYGREELGMAVDIGDNSEWGQEVGHTVGLTFADTVGVSHLLRVRGKDRKKGSKESDKDSEKLWGEWNKQLIKAKKKNDSVSPSCP